MTRKYLVYALVALAAVLAGCVFLQGAAPAIKQVEKGIAPLISLPEDVPQVPPVPSIPSSPAAAFDLGGARWMKYRLIDGSGGTGEVRLEYSPESGMVSILRTLSSEDASAMSSSDGGLFYSMRYSSSQSSTTSRHGIGRPVKGRRPRPVRGRAHGGLRRI